MKSVRDRASLIALVAAPPSIGSGRGGGGAVCVPVFVLGSGVCVVSSGKGGLWADARALGMSGRAAASPSIGLRCSWSPCLASFVGGETALLGEANSSVFGVDFGGDFERARFDDSDESMFAVKTYEGQRRVGKG